MESGDLTSSQRPAGVTERLFSDLQIAIALALVSAIFLWLTTARWPQTPDGLFHLQRVRAVSEALAAGVLYPRWFPDFAFGYGYPVLNYYAPATYYPPAFLQLLGVEVTTATRIALAGSYAAGGVGAYYLTRRWAEPLPALAGAVVYQFFPYRLYDLFVRGALPEFAAFLWLPWIVLLTLHAWDRWQPSAGPLHPHNAVRILPPALAWAGLILTHNLTAFMAAVGLLLMLPVLAYLQDAGIKQHRHSARLLQTGWRWLGPLGVGALLSAWYIVPALLEAHWVALGAIDTNNGYANHFATMGTLFAWSWRFAYPDAASPTVPLPAYVLLFLLASTIGLGINRPLQHRPGWAAAVVAGLVTLMALWLTTASSAFVWDLFAPILSNLQFPWRWQTLIGLGSALLAALVLTLLPIANRTRQIAALLLALMVTIYGVTGLPLAAADDESPVVTTAAMWAFDHEMGQVGATWAGEFLPRWVNEERWRIGREPESTSDARQPAPMVRVQPVTTSYLDRTYRVETTDAVQLRFQRFYFPAWTLRLNGTPIDAKPTGALGLLSVELPPGNHLLTLQWQSTLAVQVGRALTSLGWLVALALLWSGADARRPIWLASWLAIGLLGLISMSGVTQRSVAPTPIDADFAGVRLEASHAADAHAGDLAAVRLFWTANGPTEELIAFVHVVDGNGAVIAQHDGPLAGKYLPATRRPPGLVFEHVQQIPLPADLPPGDYALKAGVYRPGQVDTPVVATGTAEPRVDAGTLTVRP